MTKTEDFSAIDISIDHIIMVRTGEKNTQWKYSSQKDMLHDKPFYTLTYVKSGGILSKCGNETYKFKEGCVYLGKEPEIPYWNYSMNLPTFLYVISFYTTKPIPLKFYPDGRLKVFPKNPSLIEKLYQQALDIYIKKPVAWKISLKQITLNIFMEFIQDLYEKRLTRTMPSFLIESVNYIDENLFRETICIGDLAKKSNISTTHFLRVFKKEYGISPKKYINKIKIDSATTLLVNTDKTIAEICEQSGFNDIAYFNRAFKEENSKHT